MHTQGECRIKIGGMLPIRQGINQELEERPDTILL